ncbi:ABC-three component system middle component 7 [Tuberibacillus sp. Marseille-P3662]|uniref:ABC-three component system middle component 7 n=1 Tax=Tuberibacillus sp. Marseille-P3662 TaxID=1965358 RepID=UPI000A1C8088|nr:ABC-three component system middle component 7 [Tuberibacillus sp. Marseille-P3662]
MLVPNKAMSFKESVIGKVPIILNLIKDEDLSIHELFIKTQGHFEAIDEFIYSLDVLYLLNSIEVDFNKGVVKYVNRD